MVRSNCSGLLQWLNAYWMSFINVVVLTNFDGSIGILHLQLPDTIKNSEVPHELQEQVLTSDVVSFCIIFESKFYKAMALYPN